MWASIFFVSFCCWLRYYLKVKKLTPPPPPPPTNLNLATPWQRHTQCLFPMPDNERVKKKKKKKNLENIVTLTVKDLLIHMSISVHAAYTTKWQTWAWIDSKCTKFLMCSQQFLPQCFTGFLVCKSSTIKQMSVTKQPPTPQKRQGFFLMEKRT